jgi:gluconate 5-dehydrogenase
VAPGLPSLFDLSGRVALVTGGSRGLGAEFAEGLAEAGAALMLCARREEWLVPAIDGLRARGFAIDGLRCDVSNPTEVQAVVDKTLDRYGRIDVLVNNAGVSWAERPESMPLDQWKRVIDINLTGAFVCSQAVARVMLPARSGCIINVASIAGLQGNVHGPHYAAYAASKAGLMGLTRDLAAAWGPQGIRVNAIAPGFFHSRLADASIAKLEAGIQSATPLGRVGAPGELKGVAVFLASDAASYITGQVIVVDGGGTIATGLSGAMS